MNCSSSTLYLPPGKLGLELEASLNGEKGLRVRGWQSAVFRLSALPTGTVIRSIDDISVEDLYFNDAVAVLRDSKKRLVEYWLPQSQSSRTPPQFLSPAGSISPIGEENLYDISLGSDKKAELDVSKSPLWSRTPPGVDKENAQPNLHGPHLGSQTPSPCKKGGSVFDKAARSPASSPRRGASAGSRALQPLSSTPIKPPLPAPPACPQTPLWQRPAAGENHETAPAKSPPKANREAQVGLHCSPVVSTASVAPGQGEERLQEEQAAAEAAEEAVLEARLQAMMLAKEARLAEKARKAEEAIQASMLEAARIAEEVRSAKAEAEAEAARLSEEEAATAAAAALPVEVSPDVASAEEEKGQQARKIQQLQTEQRGADAKILLLRFQMSKIKRREQATAAAAAAAVVGPSVEVEVSVPPLVAAPAEPVAAVEAEVVAAATDDAAAPVPAEVEMEVDLFDACEREAFLLHHGRLASVLQALRGDSAAAQAAVATTDAAPASAEDASSVRDMGLQCALLADPLPAGQREGALRTELAVMERFAQRLKVQLRANIEAQISMHESISRGEVGVGGLSCCTPAEEQEAVQVQKSVHSAAPPELDEGCSATDASVIFSGEDRDQGDVSRLEEHSAYSACGGEHSSVYSCSPESPFHVLQSLAADYASPAPPVVNILQTLAADYASEQESGVVEDEANDSTLADILDTIEKLPVREECGMQTPTEKERPAAGGGGEVGVSPPRTHVKQAWTAWVVNDPKPAADMGLSPASFKDHIHRLRGANTLMRDDISRFRETLKRLTQ